MNRLTIKNSDGTYSQATDITFEKVFNRLVEYEDFMEETSINDVSELKRILTTSVVWENNQELKKYIVKNNQENQSLKNKWQELKKYIETLSNESDTISEDLFFIIDKMQELEKDD